MHVAPSPWPGLPTPERSSGTSHPSYSVVLPHPTGDGYGDYEPVPYNGRVNQGDEVRLEEATASRETASITATVVHTLFSNEETGWSAVRCRSSTGDRFTAVGTLLGVREGDELRVTGVWVQHPKFGEQFNVASFVHVDPSTLEGIRRFLGSGRIRGVGKRMAERLVEEFGLETLDVIENDPEKLRRVRGVGRKTAHKICSSYDDHRGVQQVMVFLTGHGVTPGVAAKVHKRYGATAVDAVRENPYRLADEVFGVGFLTADRIARSLGLPEDAPERHDAGLLYALQQATAEGHVFLPQSQLVTTAGEHLATEGRTLEPAVQRLVERQRVVAREDCASNPAIYLPRMERAEEAVARGARRLMDAPATGGKVKAEQALQWYQSRAGIRLAESQREALATALTHKVVVITGGPGTGKTTLVRGLTKILSRKGRAVLLASPTGRAAKRLQEATGRDARTLHRLLEFIPATGTFARNRHRPLEADMVVVDEVSMLDVELAAHLLEAVPGGCRLVLVGDADQLPSVGPGNVLADLITSGAVPVVRLDHIFRQAEESLIVVNAHRINHGQMPSLGAGDELQDFYFIARDDPEKAAETAIELATNRIPRRFGIDPIEGIQVLAPMHRGELGVSTLNERLQGILTPGGPELVVGTRRYRVGDKVMQIRNNYELDVFNGDIGRVVSLDPEERQLDVSFDGRFVTVPHDDLDDLVPAYACTIHKSQGSEYPAVVVVLHHQHYIMLQRNLLYTAVTRARRLVTIVGSRRALHRAVNNATVRRRHTMLAERLRATRR